MPKGVGWALIFSPLLILVFVWLQVVSKSDDFFLFWMYFSLFFAGLATILMLQSKVEYASRRLRRIFYVLVVILILVIVVVALWIASVPAGGTHHYSYLTPSNVETTLTYGWTTSGNLGYRGSFEQNLLEVNYPGEAPGPPTTCTEPRSSQTKAYKQT